MRPMQIGVLGDELVKVVAKTDVLDWATHDVDTRGALQEAVAFSERVHHHPIQGGVHCGGCSS